MARRYISTAKFNPYTYEQLAAPIEQATAVLSRQAQGLNALEMQNEMLGRYLDPETDAEEYAVWKQNSDNLRAASDSMLRTGLTTGNYNMFRDVTRVYAHDIIPMENAVKNRAQWASSVSQTLMQNPDAVLKGSMRRPLKEFYTGVPQTEIIKGSAIQADVATVMGAIGKYHGGVDNMGPSEFNKYQNIVRERTGMTLEQLDAMSNDPSSQLYAVIHEVMKKHGAEDMNGAPAVSDNDYTKLLNYAMSGRYAAIGEAKYKLEDNGLDKQQAHALAWAKFNQDVLNTERARVDKAAEMAYNMQMSGDQRSVDELIPLILDNGLDFRTGQGGISSSSNYMSNANFDFAEPEASPEKTASIHINGIPFSRERIKNVAKDAANPNFAPVRTGPDSWNWEKLDNWRLKPGTGDGLFRSYVTQVCKNLGIKDLGNITTNQKNMLSAKIADLAEKADVVVPKYRYDFSKTENAKSMLRILDGAYINDKSPDSKQISNAQSVSLEVDCNNPAVLKVNVLTQGKTEKYEADLSHFLNSYNMFDENLKGQLDMVAAMLDPKATVHHKFDKTMNDMFFRLPADIYKEQIGSIYSVVGATLDGLVRNAAAKTRNETKIFGKTYKEEE